jgi:oxygen-dependent protoporphyrinogen oxidase
MNIMSKDPNIQPKAVIVGGGITGLSAAWYLQSLSPAPIEITVIEANPFLGGKMITRTIESEHGKFIIDAGPESFVTRKREAWDLAQALDLSDEILSAGSETRNMYVLDGGIPKQIPLSPLAFLTSDLLTASGKLRMLAEPFIPTRRDDEDESLASFVNRRLGREALDKMIGPVLAGIYNTDPQTQSIMTTSPVMREMEKEHGGLFRGAFARMRARRHSAPDTPQPPQFITFDSGAQTLVDALEQQLHARILKGRPCVGLAADNGVNRLQLADGEILHADAVILAAPADQAARLLSEAAPAAAAELVAIRHEHIGTATLIYPPGALRLPYRINGLMVPRREGRRIDAVTWTSNKPFTRGPEGFEILRVFFGGGDPDVVTLPEEAIIAVIRQELLEILGLQAEPAYTAVFTWPHGFPQAHVGHLALVDQIESILPRGISLAGSSYRGIGIPDCIRQGRTAAEQALSHLSKT